MAAGDLATLLARSSDTHLNGVQVAQMFLDRYYQVLAKMPSALCRFYSENSTISIHIIDPNGSTYTENAAGLSVSDPQPDLARGNRPDIIADPPVSISHMQSISEKVMATIQGAVATTEFVDAQHSASGGVVLQVCGSMKKKVRVILC